MASKVVRKPSGTAAIACWASTSDLGAREPQGAPNFFFFSICAHRCIFCNIYFLNKVHYINLSSSMALVSICGSLLKRKDNFSQKGLASMHVWPDLNHHECPAPCRTPASAVVVLTSPARNHRARHERAWLWPTRSDPWAQYVDGPRASSLASEQ
jgi:hypothetical protein